jgi:hypothetical protein
LAYCPEVREKNNAQRLSYNYMTSHPVIQITKKIKSEMEAMGTKFVNWFGSGDCRAKDVRRVWDIMDRLDQMGIQQTGFTRNTALWGITHPAVNIRLALTVEKKKDIQKAQAPEGSLFAHPNYSKGYVTLYMVDQELKREIASCGYSWVESGNLITETQCCVCYENAIGCFTRL